LGTTRAVNVRWEGQLFVGNVLDHSYETDDDDEDNEEEDGEATPQAGVTVKVLLDPTNEWLQHAHVFAAGDVELLEDEDDSFLMSELCRLGHSSDFKTHATLKDVMAQFNWSREELFQLVQESKQPLLVGEEVCVCDGGAGVDFLDECHDSLTTIEEEGTPITCPPTLSKLDRRVFVAVQPQECEEEGGAGEAAVQHPDALLSLSMARALSLAYLPQEDAAKATGMSLTYFKHFVKKLTIQHWPYRQVIADAHKEGVAAPQYCSLFPERVKHLLFNRGRGRESLHDVGTRVILAMAEKGEHQGAAGYVSKVPVHPSTWYEITLTQSGQQLKLRSSSFRVVDYTSSKRSGLAESKPSAVTAAAAAVTSASVPPQPSAPPATAQDPPKLHPVTVLGVQSKSEPLETPKRGREEAELEKDAIDGAPRKTGRWEKHGPKSAAKSHPVMPVDPITTVRFAAVGGKRNIAGLDQHANVQSRSKRVAQQTDVMLVQGREHRVGDFVDVFDNQEAFAWFPAEIISFHPCLGTQIHFVGYDESGRRHLSKAAANDESRCRISVQ
jgi:hypothetical protein